MKKRMTKANTAATLLECRLTSTIGRTTAAAQNSIIERRKRRKRTTAIIGYVSPRTEDLISMIFLFQLMVRAQKLLRSYWRRKWRLRRP